MRPDISPGVLPYYQLPDHTGKLCKLSELQGDDPLILTLARSSSKEHQQHLELAAFYPKIAVSYTQIADDRHRRSCEYSAGIPCVSWSPVDIPFGHRAEKFRKISTSRSTPTPSTTRWSRIRSCSSRAS